MDRLPQLSVGGLVLITAPPKISREMMTAFTAQLALQGPVRVLDGGNQFAAYPLARLVRRYTAEITTILGRVQVARAFTCYQMLALLAQTADLPESTLILDLLSTFLDENVPLIERRYLLRQAVDHLLRLRNHAPVAISSPLLGPDQPADMLGMLIDAADHIWRFEEPQPPVEQLRLF